MAKDSLRDANGVRILEGTGEVCGVWICTFFSKTGSDFLVFKRDCIEMLTFSHCTFVGFLIFSYICLWWILRLHVAANLNFRRIGERRFAMEVWNVSLRSH
jgi:hypothetical protein